MSPPYSFISLYKKAALSDRFNFIYLATASAAVIISAYAEDNKESDDYEPNDLVVEKFAEAAIHSGFLSYCLNCRGLLPLHSYCMKAGPILLLLISQDKNKLYCGFWELCNTPDY